jgi:di/tricarboxylate transporter
VALLIGTTANLGSFGVMVAFAAAMSCLTPAASLTMPLFFEPGHITMQNSYKANLVSIFFAFVTLLMFIPVIYRIIPF